MKEFTMTEAEIKELVELIKAEAVIEKAAMDRIAGGVGS